MIYVDSAVPASGDGLSWSQAKKSIGEGLTAAVSGDELWVAAGTYTEILTLQQGVDLYGGFSGIESLREERDPTQYPATIAAPVGQMHAMVITAADIRVDGFIVTGGSIAAIRCANVGSDVVIAGCEVRGSPMEAIRCDHAQPIIDGCFIHSNGDDGVYCTYAAPTITACTIVANDDYGINCTQSSPIIIDSYLVGNKSSGLYAANYSDPYMANSFVVGHAASGVTLTTYSNLTAVNCAFISNIPGGIAMGGAIVLSGSALMDLRNSLLVDNGHRAIREGSPGINEVTNCLFYGNPDGDYFDNETWTTHTGAAAINANVNGASDNVDGDPLFAASVTGTWTSDPTYDSATGRTTLVDINADYEPASLVGQLINCDASQRQHGIITANTATVLEVVMYDALTYVQSGDGYEIKDFHTASNSPCTDAGGSLDAPDTDFDGFPRPMDVPSQGADGTGTEFDIGPYEFQPDLGSKQLRIMGIEGGGTVTPAGGTYAYGTPVQFEATPALGCTFDHWYILENVAPPATPQEMTETANPYTLTMTRNWDVWAYFTGTPQYILSVATTGPGQVAPTGGTYDEGTGVDITATADANARFVQWQGAASGSQNPLHLVMDQDKSLTAVFTYVYQLSTAVVGNGSVSPSGGTYDAGTIVELTALPDPGWALWYWQGEVSGSSNPTTVVMDGDQSATAVFTLALPDLAIAQADSPVPSAVCPGESFTLSWRVANSGFDTAAGSWNDKIYLSCDGTLDPGDRLLATAVRSGPLLIGQDYTEFVSPAMPDLAPGVYYVLVATDADDAIAEVEEVASQTAAQPITVLDPVLSRTR